MFWILLSIKEVFYFRGTFLLWVLSISMLSIEEVFYFWVVTCGKGVGGVVKVVFVLSFLSPVCHGHVSIRQEDSCQCHPQAVQVCWELVCGAMAELISLSLSCSLDPEQKDQLVEVIEKLLKDQTTVRRYKVFWDVHTHTHTHTCVHVHTHTHMHTCVYADVCAHTHTHTCNIHSRVRTVTQYAILLLATGNFPTILPLWPDNFSIGRPFCPSKFKKLYFMILLWISEIVRMAKQS